MLKNTRKTNRTLRLDSHLLNQAKKILGYKTYTEAIEKTLKAAINNKEHENIVNRYEGKLKSYRSMYE